MRQLPQASRGAASDSTQRTGCPRWVSNGGENRTDVEFPGYFSDRKTTGDELSEPIRGHGFPGTHPEGFVEPSRNIGWDPQALRCGRREPSSSVVGVQFHPELKSKPFAPHPLFAPFIEVAVAQSRLV